MEMLKIIVRVQSVDMDGYNGREHHPTKAHEGRFVRVQKVEEFPGDVFGGDAEDIQIFFGVVVDENGDDIDGEEVELVSHEIESDSGVPVLYGQEWRNVERPGQSKCGRCGHTMDEHTRRQGDEALHCPTGRSTYFTSRQ